MKFEMEAFLPSQKTMLENFGLNDGGRVQKVIDVSFMHYMKLKMPQSPEQNMTHKVICKPGTGIITVNASYAHYQNEGILYLTKDGRSFARKGEIKYPTNRKLKNYYDQNGGPGRGSHFVERTATNNFNDILNEAQKEVNKS